VSPIDTVGAGDAFCGAFASALDAGEPFSTALQWGSVAGSLACLKTGAQTALPSREEIAAHLLALPA
jgi:ribokinase